MSSLVCLVALVPLSSTRLPPDYSGIWHTEADECALTCSMSSTELLLKVKTSSLHAIDHLNLCTPSERTSDAKHCLWYRQVGRTNIVYGFGLLEDHVQQFPGQWRWVCRCEVKAQSLQVVSCYLKCCLNAPYVFSAASGLSQQTKQKTQCDDVMKWRGIMGVVVFTVK